MRFGQEVLHEVAVNIDIGCEREVDIALDVAPRTRRHVAVVDQIAHVQITLVAAGNGNAVIGLQIEYKLCGGTRALDGYGTLVDESETVLLRGGIAQVRDVASAGMKLSPEIDIFAHSDRIGELIDAGHLDGRNVVDALGDRHRVRGDVGNQRRIDRYIDVIALGLDARVIELAREELDRAVAAERAEPVGPEAAGRKFEVDILRLVERLVGRRGGLYERDRTAIHHAERLIGTDRHEVCTDEILRALVRNDHFAGNHRY